MNSQIYLTIDDGPSEEFTALVDFLYQRKIPAVFFNRGDCMEERPEAVLYGIERGFIMANHAYSHRRASSLSFEKNCEEIRRTDAILEGLYAQAGVARPGKYFRFPYMDRGMGPFFVEPDGLPEAYRAAQEELLDAGLGHKPAAPDAEQIAKKRKIQGFLQSMDYTILPVENVTIPWYAQTEMARAVDSLCTYSTSDWALLARHRGKRGFSTVRDLKDRIDRDPWLRDETSRHIVLAHDQAEIHGVTKELIAHFQTKGFRFRNFTA